MQRSSLNTSLHGCMGCMKATSMQGPCNPGPGGCMSAYHETTRPEREERKNHATHATHAGYFLKIGCILVLKSGLGAKFGCFGYSGCMGMKTEWGGIYSSPHVIIDTCISPPQQK